MTKAKNDLTANRYIGKPCPRHPELGGLRARINGTCVQCVRERASKWLEDNRERARVRSAEWKAANPDLAKQRAAEYYLQNAKARLEYVVAWRGKNPHKVAQYRIDKRCCTKLRTPRWADQKKIRAVYAKARRLSLTVDHVVPLQGKLVSGLHVDNNLQLLPGSDNSRKRNAFDPWAFVGDGLDL